ncbi:MAG: isoleucine--tRNA ligase, partial [Pseudobdellovibrionaceae bacterium]
VEKNAKTSQGASNEFVFYDGPPFANGLPHYGHLVTGYVKDLIPRYQTMKGHHVERRFGWDCHGLPAELEVERETGISGTTAIKEYGIEKFNAACEASVLKYTKEWQNYVTRQGRWVSFEDEYKTLDRSYMESVIWAFKSLWDKGLIYEGYRVVPYSWAVQSPLSNFETRLDNSYRQRTDPALTVGFLLNDASAFSDTPVRIMAWTTTPWTLPSNMGLAISPDLSYVMMEKDGARIVLAHAALERYAHELKGWEAIKDVTPSQLEGLTYTPLFPYFADKASEGAFKIHAADFVEAESGTGIVHIAPGFGEDDMELGKTRGIPVVVPVDEAGEFTSEVPDYKGQNVILEANANVIADLKKQDGVVLKHEQILHSYPHCWRTDQPLIYKAVTSWYVAVSTFKDRMVELNQDITWVPEHVKNGAFGNWLANARDWNISRNRFWGTPLPVWRSDDPAYPRIDVYGSIEELERDFGVKVDNLHRPMIDDLVRANPDDPTGKSMMRRIPDVLDCWFESGSMPFAQQHYPFENQERFEANFPGDFIVEYIAQTRGWFYTLMVLSTALFDRAPFKSCICHGVVLDEDKQKLSKRKRNYPNPIDVFNTQGSDALRCYLLSSPLMVGGDLAISSDDSDIAKAMRAVIIRLWNAYHFFTLYANIDGVEAKLRTDQTNPLDHYIIGKTGEIIETIEKHLDNLNIPEAYNAMTPYIDILNNWYIRNRRPAFWAGEMTEDKQSAYDTLYTSLVYFTKAVAPLIPFLADTIYSNLTGEESVHLADWPDYKALTIEPDVLKAMDLARESCGAVLRLREQHKRRVRLPLKKLTIAHPQAKLLEQHLDLIKSFTNLVDIELVEDPAQFGTRTVKVNPQLGRQFGAKFKDIMTAQREGNFELQSDGKLAIAGEVLGTDDFELRIQSTGDEPTEAFDSWKGLAILDITIYPELEREGWSRDFIRIVQQLRKDRDYNVTDKIVIVAKTDAKIAEALDQHKAAIQRETLAQDLSFVTDMQDNENIVTEEIEDSPLALHVSLVG